MASKALLSQVQSQTLTPVVVCARAAALVTPAPATVSRHQHLRHAPQHTAATPLDVFSEALLMLWCGRFTAARCGAV